MTIEELLGTYPRVRPELPEEHRRVYEKEYRDNRDGKGVAEGLAKKMEGWMHEKVSRPSGDNVLELGAGTLNHLQWEREVLSYDVVEPFKALYQGVPLQNRVRAFYHSVHTVPTANRYKRIVSVAALEHMTNLPAEIASSALLMDKDGVFQAGIPSEGGFLWWLGWRMTTGISYFLRNRLDYGVLMRHEHINSAPEICSVIQFFFRDVSLWRFPLPAHHLSLYGYIEARNPDVELCGKYSIANRPG